MKDFEKRFQPGTDDGVIDGLYMPWLLFDLRFGKSGKTVCERFLEDSMMKKLGDPGLSLIRHMSDSYATFYEVIDSELRNESGLLNSAQGLPGAFTVFLILTRRL